MSDLGMGTELLRRQLAGKWSPISNFDSIVIWFVLLQIFYAVYYLICIR